MKVVLVLCLLAFMSCQKDIIDIAKCLYESPKVKEIISDVMVAIATKDFSKLWPKIKESLPELIPVVIKCVMTEDEINLTSTQCTKGEKFLCGLDCFLAPFSKDCKDCSIKCGLIEDEEQEPSKDN